MSVDADRTVNNVRDVGRKIPTTAMAPRVLAETEGIYPEKITGPAQAATVVLSYPAVSIVHIFAYTTADGSWPAVNPPNPLEGTDYSVVLENANGVAAITELNVADRSAETWLVLYRRVTDEGTIGGQSSVVPTDI